MTLDIKKIFWVMVMAYLFKYAIMYTMAFFIPLEEIKFTWEHQKFLYAAFFASIYVLSNEIYLLEDKKK